MRPDVPQVGGAAPPNSWERFTGWDPQGSRAGARPGRLDRGQELDSETPFLPGQFSENSLLYVARVSPSLSLADLGQVPVPHSSCGPPTGCTSHPSDPVSLFLASNEAVNELDRSPTLPLELDG